MIVIRENRIGFFPEQAISVPDCLSGVKISPEMIVFIRIWIAEPAHTRYIRVWEGGNRPFPAGVGLRKPRSPTSLPHRRGGAPLPLLLPTGYIDEPAYARAGKKIW